MLVVEGMGVLLGIWKVGIDETTQEGGIDIGYIGGWVILGNYDYGYDTC